MKKIICWIIVVLWMGIIFTFSSFNGVESSKQSRGFLYHTVGAIIDIFNKDMDSVKKDELIIKINPVVRKIAHTSVYFGLGLFVCMALNNYDLDKRKLILYSLTICFLYACSDEIHQSFVPGRSAEILDVCIDTFGSCIGIWLFSHFKAKSLHN